ncbi:hypothetical protein OG689_41760 [Kitasatospora sp. NBC_00240]|uniref:hypothetical protein n=1 Tax=Kitasatospora sp. NBC_00240 TaxID=2903567 RepID=UPI00224F8E9B|nr:hypothetical protein [Kitasatospora sp. NBC_00240]MCX5215685.1 hypothetical protein [Kitasatospora sp. NBC_00240]
MSDSSTLQLIVHTASEEDAPRVLEAIAEQTLDQLEGDEPESGILALGQRYWVEQTPVGSSFELAAHLIEHAPSAALALWQDPNPPAAGHYVAHVPGTGTYESDCDAEGNPYIGVKALAARLAALPEGITVAEWLAGDGSVALGISVLEAVRRYEPERNARCQD